jgi:hypothetical protein
MEDEKDVKERLVAKSFTCKTGGDSIRIEQEFDGDGFIISISNPSTPSQSGGGSKMVITTIRLNKRQMDALYDTRYNF